MESENRLKWLYNELKDLNVGNIKHVQQGDLRFIFVIDYETKKRKLGIGIYEEIIEKPECLEAIINEIKYQRIRDSRYYPLWSIWWRIKRLVKW